MKIRFMQSGGFAGLIRGSEVDAAALDEGAAASLRALLDLSAGEGLPPRSEKGRDLGQYELEIEHRGEVRRISFDDLSVPECAAPLLGVLMAQAKPMKPR